MLKELGVDHYRFSISWTRILPSGFSYDVSQSGIDFYNKIINALLKAKIIPMVTIYHWDLPQNLQLLGGWANAQMADYFEDYAKLLFDNFGDRVKLWITFNEPRQICLPGYGSNYHAPAINLSGIADYKCGHSVLLAHSRIYHLYNNTYKPTQKGKIGISLNTNWFEPKSQNESDIYATERAFQFSFGWFANAIFTKSGDYPDVMRRIINENGRTEGFSHSRLPFFSEKERKNLLGTADFLGLNYYATKFVADEKSPFSRKPSSEKDLHVTTLAAASIQVHAKGFTKLMQKIKQSYDNPLVLITENGYSSNGDLINDKDRVDYIFYHLNALLDAIDSGCNVKAYTFWSLMDNFEWAYGYTKKFGLYEVDFSSPNRTRTARLSAKFYKYIIETKSIPST